MAGGHRFGIEQDDVLAVGGGEAVVALAGGAVGGDVDLEVGRRLHQDQVARRHHDGAVGVLGPQPGDDRLVGVGFAAQGAGGVRQEVGDLIVGACGGGEGDQAVTAGPLQEGFGALSGGLSRFAVVLQGVVVGQALTQRAYFAGRQYQLGALVGRLKRGLRPID